MSELSNETEKRQRPTGAATQDDTGPTDREKGRKDERRYCRTTGPCGQIRRAQIHDEYVKARSLHRKSPQIGTT
ncbi:hypothetical protein [Herbaspirillum sp. C9C3]|uniref:hypothetical protein n=1 Tax=Herbaspirillum sp. C9C3 TaxID=2735271 RepID=UPI0015851B14|nr:hypothetical protein [Herbaspirillum sp. C9C3]NUT63743.1 hypothetical protein [Herbaspirillum sp. C9C3]